VGEGKKEAFAGVEVRARAVASSSFVSAEVARLDTEGSGLQQLFAEGTISWDGWKTAVEIDGSV
jgi:hypothetical protein